MFADLRRLRCPVDHSLPDNGAEVEGSLVLVAVSDFPTAGGHRHCPIVVTGYLATGCGQKNHRRGYLVLEPDGAAIR